MAAGYRTIEITAKHRRCSDDRIPTAGTGSEAQSFAPISTPDAHQDGLRRSKAAFR
jgi:hypothetical protein